MIFEGESHMLLEGDSRTICGRIPVRRDNSGQVVMTVRVTTDHALVTCHNCKRSPAFHAYKSTLREVSHGPDRVV